MTTHEKAALAVATRARSAADCRELLDALGLLDTLSPRPKQRRGRPPMDHGHGHPATYRQGCRCDECREANRQRYAKQRAARAKDPTAADRAGHGRASTYKNYACRCTECSKANTAACKASRVRRRMRAAAAEVSAL